jgi:hypothetical protein
MELFGSGLMWGTPLTDGSGASVATPTPYLFGTMQDVELDIKFEIKKLHGQNAFPKIITRGKGSISGKAKAATIFGGMLDSFVFGQASTAGSTAMVYDTTGTVVPTSPFTITVTPPNSGVFDADLGVFEVATGRPLKRSTAAPANKGEYSVNPATGVYTFHTGAAGASVYINYRYTATSNVARKGSVVNRPMGYTPSFRTDLYFPFQDDYLVLTLHNTVSDGLKLSFKNDDFSIPEFGFDAGEGAGGKILDWSMSE